MFCFLNDSLNAKKMSKLTITGSLWRNSGPQSLIPLNIVLGQVQLLPLNSWWKTTPMVNYIYLFFSPPLSSPLLLYIGLSFRHTQTQTRKSNNISSHAPPPPPPPPHTHTHTHTSKNISNVLNLYGEDVICYSVHQNRFSIRLLYFRVCYRCCTKITQAKNKICFGVATLYVVQNVDNAIYTLILHRIISIMYIYAYFSVPCCAGSTNS